jgi:hypothetical protein
MKSLQPVARRLLVRTSLNIDWRIESLAVTMILAETAVAYVYIGALLPARTFPYAPFPALLLAGVMLVGYAVPRVLELLLVRSSAYEVVTAFAVCLSLVIVARLAMFPSSPWLDPEWLAGVGRSLILRPSAAERPAWGVIAIVVYAWWRGRTRGEPSLEAAYELFRWGSLAMAGGLVLALAVSEPAGAVRSTLPSAVFWFVTAALAAIALARLRLEALRGSEPLGGTWFLAVAGALGLVALLAVVLAGLVSRQVLEFLWVVLGPLLWVALFLVRVVVLLLALLTFVVILPLLWFLERHGLGRSLVAGRAEWLLEPLARLHEVARLQLTLADPVRYLLAVVVLTTVVSWLVRWVYRRRSRWRRPTSEERESVFERRVSIRAVSRRVRDLVRRRRRVDDPLAWFRDDPRWHSTLHIRLAYRGLLRRARAVGLGRRPPQTPAEYARLLARAVPELTDAVRELTGLYERARYRPIPARPEEAETAQRLSAVLQRVLTERRSSSLPHERV